LNHLQWLATLNPSPVSDLKVIITNRDNDDYGNDALNPEIVKHQSHNDWFGFFHGLNLKIERKKNGDTIVGFGVKLWNKSKSVILVSWNGSCYGSN